MDIILKRCHVGERVTDGELYIRQEKVCDTAENTLHMLPYGKYDVVFRKIPIIGRIMPVIRLKPSFPLGLLRDGNGAYSFQDGSVLVGEHYLPGICLKSGETFKKLCDRLEKQYRRKNFIRLIIR